MKRRYTALFLALALVLTIFCACGQQPVQPTTDSTQDDQSAAPERESAALEKGSATATQKNKVQKGEGTTSTLESKAAKQQSLTPKPETSTLLPEPEEVRIIEMYSEDGTGYDGEGNQFTYSYHVPQIDDDTPGAAAINAEIAELYGVLTEASLESIENQELPGYHTVSYESYRSGDILCLVMKCGYYYGPEEEYLAYSYDTAKGVRLGNVELLLKLGVTADQYLHAVRCAAAKRYDDQYHHVWEDQAFDSLSGEYQERRSWTLSAKNINLSLPLYLNNEGKLCAVVPVGSHAGSDRIYCALTLEMEDKSADVERNETLTCLTVTRRGGEVTLRFNQTADSAVVLETDPYMDEVPYGLELPVNGLYGDYTRTFCNLAGEGNTPYVFLLTREGRVEYVDVMTCLRCGYFCASGPLLGVENVVDFTTAFDEENVHRIYAITDSGEQVDLTELVQLDQYCMISSAAGSWGRNHTVFTDDGDSYEEYQALDLFEGGLMNLNCYRFDQEEQLGFDGYLVQLGMTADGAVYAYRLWGNFSNGPAYQGVIALEVDCDYGEYGADFTLNIKELGGTALFGTETGETTCFVQTFG